MVTYICDLHIGYGVGLMVVSAKNKKVAIDIMHMYLISHYLNISYDLKYITENIKELKEGNIEVDYCE